MPRWPWRSDARSRGSSSPAPDHAHEPRKPKSITAPPRRRSRLRALEPAGGAESGPEALAFEPLVEIGDVFAVSVEDQRRPPLAGADHLLARLAPARMRHRRIDVGPEAVFGGLQRLPQADRPLLHEREAHDRLDRLEAVLPRHREPQRRALH